VKTVFDAYFFHYGIALNFTGMINRIICSVIAVYATTHDASSFYDENMHFSFGTRIQMRTYTDKAISLLENSFSHHTLMRRLSVRKT
jgi:hypothetical protein